MEHELPFFSLEFLRRPRKFETKLKNTGNDLGVVPEVDACYGLHHWYDCPPQ